MKVRLYAGNAFSFLPSLLPSLLYNKIWKRHHLERKSGDGTSIIVLSVFANIAVRLYSRNSFFISSSSSKHADVNLVQGKSRGSLEFMCFHSLGCYFLYLGEGARHVVW